MAFNFVAIQAAIKAVITAAGFQYVPVHDWGNFEEGIFPEALNDKGYAILYDSMDASEYEQVNRNMLFARIEFVLETANDLYLATLDDVVAAIGSLSTITATSLCNVLDPDGTLQNFNTQYLEKDRGLGKVIVQFPNIRMEIQE